MHRRKDKGGSRKTNNGNTERIKRKQSPQKKQTTMKLSKHNSKRTGIARIIRNIAAMFLSSFNTVSKYHGYTATYNMPGRGTL